MFSVLYNVDFTPPVSAAASYRRPVEGGHHTPKKTRRQRRGQGRAYIRGRGKGSSRNQRHQIPRTTLKGCTVGVELSLRLRQMNSLRCVHSVFVVPRSLPVLLAIDA